MSQKKNNLPSFQRLPTKWALGVVLCLVAYAAVQPLANSRFGLNLPSLTSLLEQGGDGSRERADASIPQDDRSTSTERKSGSAKESSEPSGQAAEAIAAGAPGDAPLRYGLLRETAPNDYLSPAGLRYTPMSGPENHRLEHIERHLSDQPDRSGKHGVFDGDMPQVLRWLDEAYERGKRGASGTRKHSEEGRDVYEVSFSGPVGFVGGQQGKRERNPDARSIRLVLEGNRVITAFPF